VRIDDFYGPGKDLVLNSQGFRDEEDVTTHVPDDTRRAICSGDSFTLGFGVGNGDSWCAMLEALNPGLQTVNMGQGGYGLDQVYLWYLRDGLELEHDAQLLAFIQDELRRVGVRHFLGYGKPTLYVEADSLRVEPARFHGPIRRWLARNGHLFRELRAWNSWGGQSASSGSQVRSMGQAIGFVIGESRMRSSMIWRKDTELKEPCSCSCFFRHCGTTMGSFLWPEESWSRTTRPGPGSRSWI
jgi:hypothetical protein